MDEEKCDLLLTDIMMPKMNGFELAESVRSTDKTTPIIFINAIEITHLSKSFCGMYGFICENGSGKSTTEKLICGHFVPDGGQIKLFGKDYTDAGVRVRVGALIENAGCFPGASVYQNKTRIDCNQSDFFIIV